MTLNLKKTTAAVVAATACAVAGGLAASPAQAASSGSCYYAPGSICKPVMSTSWIPWMSPTSPGTQYWTISKGTRVNMICWTTGVNRLNTAKWFKVASLAYPYTTGYVPANAVANQITVGHC